MWSDADFVMASPPVDLELLLLFGFLLFAVDRFWGISRELVLGGLLEVVVVVRFVGDDEADRDGEEFDVDELSVAIREGCLFAVVMLMSSGGFPVFSFGLLSLELRLVLSRLVEATTSGALDLGFVFEFPVVGVMLMAELFGCRLLAYIVLDNRDKADAAAATS